MEFELDAKKTVKLFWDTQGKSEGVYTAVVSVMPSSGGKDVRVKTASFPAVAVELGKTKGLQSTYIAIAGVALVVVVALVFLLFKRKKTE